MKFVMLATVLFYWTLAAAAQPPAGELKEQIVLRGYKCEQVRRVITLRGKEAAYAVVCDDGFHHYDVEKTPKGWTVKRS